jgi:hypothetical protein
MLKSYLKIALRNLSRQRLFTMIHVAALANPVEALRYE